MNKIFASHYISNAERKVKKINFQDFYSIFRQFSLEQNIINFFEVTEPFELERAIPLNLTNAGWTNQIKTSVITDLSLVKPVAKGDLYFDKANCDQNLKDEVTKLVDKSKLRKG